MMTRELVVLQADAQAEGGHVNDDRLLLAVARGQRILDVASERRQHQGLHRRAQRHHFFGRDVAARVLAQRFLDDALDQRDAGGAADEQDGVDLVGRQAGVADGGLHRLGGLLDQVA